MIELLQKAGLQDREARVYLSALELGKSPIDKIAKTAGLQRTTAYNYVEALMKKGLMTTITENKRTYYSAESPDHIVTYIEKQKDSLTETKSDIEKVLPQLLLKHNKDGSKPVVRMFSGKDGLLTMREEVLKMTGKELLVVSSYEKFLETFTEAERDSFSKRRKRKKIKSKVIWTYPTAFTPLPKLGPEEFKQVDEKKFPLDFDVYIYDNSVAISSAESEMWGIIIESKAVASSMRTLFAMAWLLP